MEQYSFFGRFAVSGRQGALVYRKITSKIQKLQKKFENFSDKSKKIQEYPKNPPKSLFAPLKISRFSKIDLKEIQKIPEIHEKS